MELRIYHSEATFVEGRNTAASQLGLACMYSWFVNLRSQAEECSDNSANL